MARAAVLWPCVHACQPLRIQTVWMVEWADGTLPLAAAAVAPRSLLDGDPYATPTWLRRRFREAELKHGRVAMLAAWGMITADKYHPLFDAKLSSNPLLAITQTPKLGLIQIFVFIGFFEVLGILNSRRPDYEPGNFLGSSQWELDETWDSYQTKELNNGRLAMFGSIGMLTGSYITGKGPLEVLDLSTVIS